MQLQTNQTMSSREIAELTGKEHRSVLRDIDKLNESYLNLGMHKIVQGYYLHENTGTQKHREMLLSEIQTMDLMTGYNLELRIKVNRRWKELEQRNTAIDFSNPETVLLLAQNWKNEKDRADLLQIENTKLDLKSQFVDVVFNSEKNLTLSQVVKLLKLPFGRNNLAKDLRSKGIFFKSTNEPKQTYVDRGYFEVFAFMSEKMSTPKNQTVVTQKGLAWLAKVYGVTIPSKNIMKFS